MAEIATALVLQLCEDATAKAEDAAAFFERLMPEQARVRTEIGWTVAATAWHLGFGASLSVAQLGELKRDKVRRLPRGIVNAINRVTIPFHRTTPPVDSAARIRAETVKSVALLREWRDDELATPLTQPYNNATTYEALLRGSLVVHFDDHMGQIRRALRR